MLIDLAQPDRDATLETQVCIVGAGPAGLTLARALAVRGINVVLVEIGGSIPEVRSDRQDFVFDRREYKGATLGRAFGFGGTSAFWGGGLLPVRPTELAARDAGTGAWPLAYSDIEDQFDQLQTWLGVDTLPFDLKFARQTRHPLGNFDWQGLDPRFLKWIPFRGRNLASAWTAALSKSGRVRICLNATLDAFDIGGPTGARNVRRIQLHGSSGRNLGVSFDKLVVCAGALESPRLVRRLDEVGALDPRSRAHLGRYLHDHLSVCVATVDVIDRSAFLMHFAPIFHGSTMHTLRLELDPKIQAAESLPPAYAHFVPDAPDDSGFAVLRDLLRKKQQKGLFSALPELLRLPAALPEVAEIAMWRLARNRLAIPRRARISLMIDFEQPARPDNRVYPGNGDGPWHLDWDLSCHPGRLTEATMHHLTAWWSRNRLDRVARLNAVAYSDIENLWPSNLFDIYHPAGTTRMASLPENGVVDSNLRIFGTGNAYVLSTSTFPSLGAANPTFTLMALALRLATHLA